MYQLRTKGGKRDPIKNWALPEKVFFACGACHILAYAFLEAYPDTGFAPIWIRPAQGYTGNHILVVRGNLAFDYHGYSDWRALFVHFKRRATQRWPGWDAELVELPERVLISESESTKYEGLRLREPTEFLFNSLDRARKFLMRFPAPRKAILTGTVTMAHESRGSNSAPIISRWAHPDKGIASRSQTGDN